jgi:hypothetical protein
MSENENIYSRSKIYKLVSNSTDKIYVGSTTQPRLCVRMAQHKSDYKGYLKGKRHYVSSYELIKFEDCEIVLLESVPCANKDELIARERYHIQMLDCVNKIVPGRSAKDYYIDKKDKFKQYRTNNKEKIAKKRNQKQKCICGGIHTLRNKARHLRSVKHLQFTEIEDKKIILTGLRELLDTEHYNSKRHKKNIENCIVKIQWDIISLSTSFYKL